MLRLSGSTLLTLILASPGASLALGLGDIHVESALHQPLVAQIELVGATSDDLAKLNGGIASEEIFQRYGLERPAVLSGATLVVGKDSQGRPVLILRSTETLTEPAITLLVDVHSSNGELIREYTVLLDPPGFASEPGGLNSAPSMSIPATVAQTSSLIATPELPVTGLPTKPPVQTYTVAPRDTLDRIVSIAGARSRSDRRRMMIAIFRANPTAFQTNLNILRRGATLHFPTVDQLSAISAADANHEYDAQMAAWRAPNHRVLKAAETDRLVLTERVESLEKSLHKLRQELKKPLVIQATRSVATDSAPAPKPIKTHAQLTEEPVPTPRRGILFAALAVAFTLVLAVGAWIYRLRRNAASLLSEPQAQQESSLPPDTEEDHSAEPSEAAPPLQQTARGTPLLAEQVKGDANQASPKPSPGGSSRFNDSFSTLMADLLASDRTAGLASARADDPEPRAESAAAPTDDAATTAILAPGFESDGDTVEQQFGFFNPESNANTTHVVLSSTLNQPPPFVERRKSPADVLRQAIEREPHRSDLRLKLIELYYTTAAENRRAFLEATRQLAKNEKLASAEEWSRITDMGRAIAPEDELFSNSMDDKAVA